MTGRAEIDALFSSHDRNEADVLIEAFAAVEADYRTQGWTRFPDPDGLAWSALVALADAGYEITLRQ